jgi:hypothetical protein
MTTCTTMLEQMLVAELDELAGGGDAALATHLRHCATCRAVADRLLRDTEMLGRSIRSVNRMPGVAVAGSRAVVARRVSAAALVAVAASVAVVAIRPSRGVTGEARVASVVRRQPAGPVLPYVPAQSSGTPATPRVSSPRLGASDSRRLRGPRPIPIRERARAVEMAAVTVAPIIVAAADPVVPVKPVKLDLPPRQSLGNAVAVDPPAGTRADIIRTDRPGVTVVWLR